MPDTPTVHSERSLLQTVEKIAAAGQYNAGYAYRNAYDFVAREGKWYRPSITHLKQGRPRACFGNAIDMAVVHGLAYVEGYATNDLVGGLPVHHAWNVDPMGNLHDVTWGYWSKLGQHALPQGAAYLGVEFSLERADDATWNGDATVLDDHRRHWPILREPWKGEDHSIMWPRSTRLEALRAYQRGDIGKAREMFAALEAEL